MANSTADEAREPQVGERRRSGRLEATAVREDGPGDSGGPHGSKKARPALVAPRTQGLGKRLSQRLRKLGLMDRGKSRIRDPERASAFTSSTSELRSLPHFVEFMRSDDPAKQFEGTRKIRMMLSKEKDPPINQVVESGVVPILVLFLRRDEMPGLQHEAAWCLTNVASGTSTQCAALVAAGAVQEFVRLLRSPNAEVRNQCIWGLGNIAGDSAEMRDLVLRANALPDLLYNLKPSEELSNLRNGVWALSNLCRGRPAPAFEQVKDALPALRPIIYSADTEVLTDACWALSYLSDGSNVNIEAVLVAGVLPRLVDLLKPDTVVAVLTPALRTVGNVVTGHDAQTQQAVDANAVAAFAALVVHAKVNIVKEACWALSNVAAGTTRQIQAVLDSGVIADLVRIMPTVDHFVRREICWVFSNAASGGTPEQIRFLVAQGCIKRLCDFVDWNVAFESRDNRVALEGLQHIIRSGVADGAETRTNAFLPELMESGFVDNLREAVESNPDNDVPGRAILNLLDGGSSNTSQDPT